MKHLRPSVASALLEEIATAHGVTVGQVASRHDTKRPFRYDPLPAVRQAFAVAMRGRGYSLTEIARALNIHHTSVLSALRYSAQKLERNGNV